MSLNLKPHERQSIRLKGYDYSQPNYYFVTVCTYDHICIFGEINYKDEGKLFYPTEAGRIAEQCWNEIPKHYPNIILDNYIVMPNHIHGIIIVGANNYSPVPTSIGNNKQNNHPKGASRTIGAIVRGYKIGVTKWFHQNTNINNVWQRNYYEHIIRNERDLLRIRDYITNNPLNWEKDKNNPNHSTTIVTELPCTGR